MFWLKEVIVRSRLRTADLVGARVLEAVEEKSGVVLE